MLDDTENASITTPNTAAGNVFSPKKNLTSTSNSQPFKIILYPPKNKAFHYDNESNSFQVHSVETHSEPNIPSESLVCDDYIISSTPDSIENNSGLTPLVDLCKITVRDGISEPSITYQANQTIYDSCEENVKEVLVVKKVFKESKLKNKCFLKGCQWSPDGLCLLANSDDNILRLFEVSENLLNNPQNDINPVFQVKEGGTIYDFTWYPLMNSSDPVSCVFVSASQYAPIHLWDAYTGLLRATYQPINQFDEVTSAYSVAFNPDGSKLYSGYKKFVRIFNTSIPGRVSESRPLKVKGNPIFQSNIVSTICINPFMPSLYAVGCYDKTIGIYGEPDGDLLFILKGHTGGVTQVKFSRDGHYLFSGGRKDPEILCWDMRNPGKVVYSCQRQVDTQQKIHFDITADDNHLVTGTTDCNLKLYNLKNSPTSDYILNPIITLRGHEDCINGVHFHPQSSFMASTSGQRHFFADDQDQDSNDSDKSMSISGDTFENSLKIWSLSNIHEPAGE